MGPLRIALLGGAAALALSLGAAFAANADAVAPKGPAAEKRILIYDDGQGDHREMRWEGGEHHGEHMAEHLRAVLQLTPAQEPALQAFLTAMKPPAHEHEDGEHRMERRIEIRRDHDASPADMAKMKEDMAKAHAEMAKAHEEMEKHRAEMAAMTTPQKLDLMVKHMNEHMAEAQARMQRHVAAVKTFYAALTPSQQKAFDVLHDGMGGMHEGGPMGGPGGDWDGGMHREMHEHMGMMAPPPPPPPLPPLPPLAMTAPPAPPAPPPPPPAF